MSSLHDNVILITGATGGIGSAVARRLRREQATVVLAARTEARLRNLADELSSPYYTADATVSDQVEALVSEVSSRYGRLDGVIHAIGSMLLKPAHITSPDEFKATIDMNLTSAFLLLKHGVKPMMATGGSMVFFSTVAAGIGLANHEAIAAAKAGLEGMVRSAAASYAGKNIRINAVAPSLTRTPLAEKITANQASLKISMAMHPLGRIGEPEDIASAAVWLIDPANSWITGQILRVDGGLSTVRPR